MAFEVELTKSAKAELKAIRVFDRRRIVDEIYNQLGSEPLVATRNRKCLDAAEPSFEHVPPIWELRVGDYRVFYDVNEEALVVYVRAVRRKERGQTTEDIIHERNDS
ncbi:MAG TPA: type II toxin-antitoxin system RelE/ParE family toxin [Gemmataceae bacterium]|nr:type II toxin-antitoxin system RelE/ParE family toxin [Gemmataceae bacterium]